MKPLNGVQLVQVQPGQSRSGQAGSECCHSPGDWWVRSVHSKEAGREESAPTSFLVAEADAVIRAEGRIGGTVRRGPSEPPESRARGTFPKGHPRNPGELPISFRVRAQKVPDVKGDRRRSGRMDEQSYEPIVPVKVGNRRAPERGGHDTHWREGGNKRT